MHSWLAPASIILTVGLALGSCGSDSSDAPATTDPPTTEEGAATTAPATSENAAIDDAGDSASESDAGAGNDADEIGCDQLLTAEEIDSILGTAVEISGSGSNCQLVFADDSIGSLQIFTGSQAAQAMDALLPAFLNDPTASAAGVALDDDRGFVDGASAVVLGDSGRLFRFDAPSNLASPDIQAAMQQIAGLLLNR